MYSECATKFQVCGCSLHSQKSSHHFYAFLSLESHPQIDKTLVYSYAFTYEGKHKLHMLRIDMDDTWLFWFQDYLSDNWTLQNLVFWWMQNLNLLDTDYNHGFKKWSGKWFVEKYGFWNFDGLMHCLTVGWFERVHEMYPRQLSWLSSPLFRVESHLYKRDLHDLTLPPVHNNSA